MSEQNQWKKEVINQRVAEERKKENDESTGASGSGSVGTIEGVSEDGKKTLYGDNEKRDKEERVVHIKDGRTQAHSRAVNTGTRNRYGTVIYKARSNRGSARGAVSPRVITIPRPPQPTPPPAEPEPADASEE